MPDYRRDRTPGGCYFFTVNLADRGCDLLVSNIGLLRNTVWAVRANHPFTIDAWVVLPEHMHAIWTMPAGDCDYSTRWATIKRLFSWGLANGEARNESRVAKRERGIWQRRFWEHKIRDERDYATHVDYVHFKPVKHGLVNDPAAWPFSTIHRALRRGDVPSGRGADGPRDLTGERQ
jgi:putative transposase